MTPKTASEAVKAYDQGVPIDSFHLRLAAVPNLLDISAQAVAYKIVFEILRKADGLAFVMNSYRQFDSWCFQNGLAQPRLSDPGRAPAPEKRDEAGNVIELADPGRMPKTDAADMARCDAIKGFCFGVLREGWQSVVERNLARGAQKIVVKKS